MQRNRFMLVVLGVVGIVAGGVRADDNAAFVDEQVARVEAGEKARMFSMGMGVFVAEDKAIQALGERGVLVASDAGLRKLYEERVIPVLIRGLGDPESNRNPPVDTWGSLMGAFEKIGVATTLPALLEAMAHEGKGEVRAGVAKALGEMRPRVREAVPALIAALHDEEALVRLRAAYSLTDFALKDEEARAAVVQALGDADVREGVSDFANAYGSDVERDAPEILRALEARGAADPVRRVAGWLYHGFVGLAGLSLVVFIYGMFFRRREQGVVERTSGEMIPGQSLLKRGSVNRFRSLFAWTRGISWSYSESMDLSDLIEGLKVGDSKCIDFAMRGPAFGCCVVSIFLAGGFGSLYYGYSAGWVVVGFMVIFMGMVVMQIRLSYRMRRERGEGR